MNQTIGREWVRRLRSGEYPQGYGVLRSDNDTFCCLGVLCDMAVEAGIVERVLRGDCYLYSATGSALISESASETILPDEVQAWAGLQLPDPGVTAPSNWRALGNRRPDEQTTFVAQLPDSLVSLNDTGYPFNEIADIIEEQLLNET